MEGGEIMESERSADVLSIEQLKSRYFRYLDTKQWDRWRTLFTDDLVFYVDESALPTVTTPTTTGGDSFVAYVSRALQTSVTVHHGHMPDIEFDGPRAATGVWAMYDWVDDAERSHAFHGWGHYHEHYRKGSDGAWRIAELRLTRLRVDAVEPTRPAGERPWPPPWEAPTA
jgi:hypothetical protein